MPDWAQLYAEHVEALAALAAGLDDEELVRTVPGSPMWRVADVYAHLAGVPADQVTGRTEGAPGPEWTARHIAERQGLALPNVVEELRSHVPAITESLAEAAFPGVLFDIAVHHADLHEALGHGAPPEHLWAPIVSVLAQRQLGELPVTVRCGEATYGADAGAPEVEVSRYELFRALFSRRSRAQIRAWTGPAPSDAELDAIGVFGPREDDQPIPS